MSDRSFLDTNIFVYSFDKSAPKKAERAAKLIRRAIEARQGIVSYQVVPEFFAFLGPERRGKARTPGIAHRVDAR